MDPRPYDHRALTLLDTIAATINPDDLRRPTPCAGWTVRDLLEHQVSENRAFARALREGSAADWHTGIGSVGTDPYRTYADSAEEFTSSIEEDAVLDRRVTVNTFGTFSGRTAIGMHLVDSVAHGWDLASALGLAYQPEDDLLAVTLAIVERIPAGPDDRGADQSFDHVVTVDPNAPALHRLLGALGRSPDWRP